MANFVKIAIYIFKGKRVFSSYLEKKSSDIGGIIPIFISFVKPD